MITRDPVARAMLRAMLKERREYRGRFHGRVEEEDVWGMGFSIRKAILAAREAEKNMVHDAACLCPKCLEEE